MGRALSSSGARPARSTLIMADSMTDEQIAVRLAGVRAEREAYVARGLDARVAACDVEIRRLTGSEQPASQARAERRPAGVTTKRETR